MGAPIDKHSAYLIHAVPSFGEQRYLNLKSSDDKNKKRHHYYPRCSTPHFSLFDPFQDLKVES